MEEKPIINTPWPSMNEITGGLLPGQLWVIGSITSTGKSSMALNIAEHAIFEQQRRVKIVSHEMGARDLLFHMVCTRARVDSVAVRNGQITPEEKRHLTETLAHFTDDRPDALEIEGGEDCDTPLGIAVSLLQSASEGCPADLLIVDYLQQLRCLGLFRNFSEEAKSILSALKQIAVQFRIPVILLGHLHTLALEEAPRWPWLGEFKEAAAIEMAADVVWILRRIDDEQQYLATQRTDAYLLDRYGRRPGKIPFRFLATYRQFEQIADYQPPPERPVKDVRTMLNRMAKQFAGTGSGPATGEDRLKENL